ncbi:MAG: lysophospholipid acyltransferase family protein [Bacteroidales bacterium]|nr:lysophospholipid acyltransferase family protein [Bacteroidales bacterium]
MNWILYYCILTPLSWLPLWMLYLLSDLTYLVVYHLLHYRRKIARQNLYNSFPEKSNQEIIQIERRYYRHLADLLAEALYGLRATPQQVLKHYKVVNREVINRYYEKGQSVILMSAHYNNWEYMVLSINFQLLHHGIGVGKPLNNKKFGQYLTQARIRYGDEVVDQTNVRQVMEYYHRYRVPCAYMMLSDQSPSNPKKSFWTHFLNQETAFLYGSEHFARKYNYPVLFYEVKKVRRGYYEIEISELCNDPARLPEGAITQLYVQRLEDIIRRQPEYWLWTHRRWKLKKNKQ